jgi:hypothetical protein
MKPPTTTSVFRRATPLNPCCEMISNAKLPPCLAKYVLDCRLRCNGAALRGCSCFWGDTVEKIFGLPAAVCEIQLYTGRGPSFSGPSGALSAMQVSTCIFNNLCLELRVQGRSSSSLLSLLSNQNTSARMSVQ